MPFLLFFLAIAGTTTLAYKAGQAKARNSPLPTPPQGQ